MAFLKKRAPAAKAPAAKAAKTAPSAELTGLEKEWWAQIARGCAPDEPHMLALRGRVNAARDAIHR